MRRTSQQNRALHKYFRLLADQLNDAGYDMKATLKPEVEIPWTDDNVKRHLWAPLQEIIIDDEKRKEHTGDLHTNEINDIYKVLDRHLSQKLGVHVEFPNEGDE